MNPFPYWAKAHGEHADLWKRAFGSTKVPILSPVPMLERIHGYQSLKAVYMLDLDYIDRPRLRARVCAVMADHLGLTAEQVDADISARGLPLLAERCTVEVRDPMQLPA